MVVSGRHRGVGTCRGRHTGWAAEVLRCRHQNGALTLRLLLHLPLRQTEGFLTSLFRLMELDLPSPDHTTLSRRGQQLDVTLHHPPREKPLHLLIDSTGLSLVGEGRVGGRETRQARLEKASPRCESVGDDRRAALTDDDDRRRADRHHAAGSGRWRCGQCDGGPSLRHPRVLRRRDRPGREGRGATGQDGAAVAAPTTLTGTRSHDPTDHADRSASLEERGRVPSAGPRGECRLPVQVDSRRWSAMMPRSASRSSTSRKLRQYL